MSLVNAVHELIEVAAGRRNLSAPAADELHAAINAEQDGYIADKPPDPATNPDPAESAPDPEELAAFRAWQISQAVPDA